MKELSILREALADARRRGALDEYTIILRGIAELQYMADLASMPTAHLPIVQREERAA